MANDNVFIGFIVLICGPLVAWVSSWLLYAFGQLVDDTHVMRNQCKIIDNIDTNLQTIAQPVVEEKVKRENEERARREAEERARREAGKRAKREAEERARHEDEERAKHEKEKTLAEKLEYALSFQTDDGMIHYLQGLQVESVQDILRYPKHLIREQIKKLLANMQ